METLSSHIQWRRYQKKIPIVCEKYDRGRRRCAQYAVKNNIKGGRSHGNGDDRGSAQDDKERALVGRKCQRICSGGGGKRKFEKGGENMTEAEADALNIL